jgi:hypothetical protein
VTLRSGRASMKISVPGAGKATAALKARIGERVKTLARSSKSATRAGTITLTFRVSPANLRLLRRTIARRPTHRTTGTAQVTFKRTGGNTRTRNRALTIAIGR